jgi:transposase
VDDWAYCKGRSYGTILIDLEKHEVIDLLEDRSAESLAAWLQDHPGVEIITRDRGPDYIEGATTGAPEAIQIADRFHLMQNVADSLKRTLQKQTKLLREAARRVAAEQQQIVNCQAAEVANSAETETDREQTLQELRFAEVKRLQAQKWSCRSIAKHLNIDRRTVGRYFAYETYPKRIPGYQSISKAAPYESYLARRWQEGCQNIKELHTELEAQGFKGSYGSVRRAVKRMLKHGQLKSTVSAETISVPRLSVTEATWLLLHQEGQLNDHQRQLRDMLCQISPDIERGRQLAQSFCQILRERKADELDQWLVEAEESAIGSLKNFATGLRRDYDAVKAAATYEWSNGQTEGQINRLKCIKRQMYGRAKFDLLRKRVLGMPAPT